MPLIRLLKPSIIAILAASSAFAEDAGTNGVNVQAPLPVVEEGTTEDTTAPDLNTSAPTTETTNTAVALETASVDGTASANIAPVQAPAQPAPTQAELTARAADYQMNRTSAVGIGQGARVVHTFDGSVARLVCQPMQICLIELEEGEVMTETPFISDIVGWDIRQPIRDTFEGGLIKQYLALEPKPDAQVATLMIFTERRVYPIQLIPDPNHHTFILSYDYPDTRARENEARVAEVRARNAAQAAAAASNRRAAVAARGVETSRGTVPAEDLRFYSITGRADFKPLRVYTDRSKTYIDLPTDYRGDIPTIDDRSGGTDGTINASVNPNRSQIVVDRQLSDFYLRVGSANVRVRIDG